MTALVYVGPRDFVSEMVDGVHVTARGRLDEFNAPDGIVERLVTSGEWRKVAAHQREVEAIAAAHARWRTQAYARAMAVRQAFRPMLTLPPHQGTLPPATYPDPQLGGPKYLAAWAQWTGASEFIADVGTSTWQQHVDARQWEVCLLAFPVAAYLVAHYAGWVPQTIIPSDRVVQGHDAPSGLDTIWVSHGGGVWGIDRIGTAYFDDDGASSWDGQHLMMIGGIPYLET